MQQARQLRKNLTDAEGKLWRVLRNRHFSGHRFRRQEPIGKYIVDFVCYEKKLIVEIDGGQHVERADYDAKRTNWLSEQGFKVLRFWNNEVLENIEVVKQVIWSSFNSSSPNPLPSRERGQTK